MSFQADPDYAPPMWPQIGEQRMMLHLDIRVDDLEDASAIAVDSGARVAGFQPQDDVRVFFDPAGHPFCLFLN
ncbi:MAG: VOC family protein [Nocardioidaceae bacterium]